MQWDKEKFDWPHHNLSNFVASEPHTWHIQDTEEIHRNKNWQKLEELNLMH